MDTTPAAPAATAALGHNNPPPYDPDVLQQHKAKATEFLVAAGEWADIKVITTEEMAERLNDFMAGARKVYSDMESARKKQKEPHIAAGKAVDVAFGTTLDALEKAMKALKENLLTPYLVEKDRREKAEQEERRRAAAAAAEEAERLRREAEARNDFSGIAESEEAAKAAAKDEKAAAKPVSAKVGSATGGTRSTGLREQKTVVVTNLNALFMALRDRPEVEELLVRLANAHVRAAAWDGVDLPGTKTKVEMV